MIDKYQTYNRLVALKADIDELISSINSIKADDDQYEDVDEWWAHATSVDLRNVINNLEIRIYS